MILKKFFLKTLQRRLIILLLLPVFLIIFSGGVLSFLYTRDVILKQWNESAVLKLQRAAHYLEMRLERPVEMMELLFQSSKETHGATSPDLIISRIKQLEGVVDVEYQPLLKAIVKPDNTMRMSHQHGMMRFYHSRISKISKPEFNSDVGHQTVMLTVAASDDRGHLYGHFLIKLSFKYLLKDILKLGWWQSDMACIVNKVGLYMAHTNMAMQGRYILGGENDPLEQAIRRKMEVESFGTVASKGYPPDMIAGFYKLNQVPWTVILFAKGRNILKPIIQYRNAYALGSGALILVILLLIRLHVGKIATQIANLSENAKKVAKGEYGEPVPVTSKDEIGQLVTTYNAMVAGLKERDFIRDSFGRYVDPEFAKYLLKHPDAGNLGGERREVVMMMSDIRGFTALSETLSPEIIIRLLNRYFSYMIAIIQEHNGIIVDFFGDAILVFFDPLSDSVSNTCLCALQCAARMQAEMGHFNRRMTEENLPELSMGIGINAGPVIVGNIGSKTRAKYGIVGSAVNITSRIQAKAKENEVVISDTIFHYTKPQVLITKTFAAQLKGVEEPLTLRVVKISDIIS